jgi:DNA helicase INO80
MAYLAEVHNIWGPFLVIAPASTLHNWQQEITRFVPALKPIPYWGSVKDRTILRKFWNRKHLRYDRDAPFHVVITSYQLVCKHNLLHSSTMHYSMIVYSLLWAFTWRV